MRRCGTSNSIPPTSDARSSRRQGSYAQHRELLRPARAVAVQPGVTTVVEPRDCIPRCSSTVETHVYAPTAVSDHGRPSGGEGRSDGGYAHTMTLQELTGGIVTILLPNGAAMTDRLNSAHDDRLDPGMTAQAQRLRDAESSGARQLGWKAGFGASAARENLGLSAPLVGFLLDTTRLESGAAIAIGDWLAPRGEAEIALRLGRDVAGGATSEQALAAIDAVAPAIELVDLDPEPERDPVAILSGNIYHRAWITGPFDTSRSGGDLRGLVGNVTLSGAALDEVTDVEVATGPAGEVLAEVARMAARHGRGLCAGDIIILGSITPPPAIATGDTLRFVLGDAPALEVRLTD